MQNVKMPAFTLIGISIRTTNENNQATQEIAALWQRFLSENLIHEIPNKVDNTIYSLYTDYESDHTKPYTALLGCKVLSDENVPEGMISKTFKESNYVKTSAKGDIMQDLIVNHWSKIFDMNLDRSFQADFEVFGKKAQNPSDAEVDFYVGVNPDSHA